jgi:cell division protein ZapA
MTDSTDKNRVVVTISGEDYPIFGVSDPSYISKVADIVDSRMNDVTHDNRAAARDRVAILAAMSIASELCEKSEQLQESERDLCARLAELVDRIDRTLGEETQVP